MKKLRKVLFREFIPPIYIDINGEEHTSRSEANKVKNSEGKSLYKKKEGTQVFSDYTKAGYFHIFSTQGDGDGIDAIAVIEIEDGTIKTVCAEHIKFID